jgi:hypothetical protein
MYDLQIIVPSIIERLDLFQKVGLHNIKDRKVLLYCLVQNKKGFTDGWPKEIDVRFVERPGRNENYRLYDFFANLSVEDANVARWTMKIDDDSYNNIDLLCTNLDSKFNYKEDFYVVGDPIRGENDHWEWSVINKLKLDGKIGKQWHHELEACVLSQSAFSKIISNQDCKNLFNEFCILNLENRYGWTDQMLGAAAKLCDIPMTADNGIIYAGKQREENDILDYYHFHPLDLNNFIKISRKLQKNYIIKAVELKKEMYELKKLI